MQHPSKPLAKTRQGTLAGSAEQGIHIWRGIPYAAPPVGPLRWRAPQPAARWQGVRPAETFSAASWQDIDYCRELGGGDPGAFSEDCLYLNVWAPASAAQPLPVMVWLHGGGFTIGAGSLPPYDGKALASRDVVVVTVNYRLGHLGFFAHPALEEEAGERLYNFRSAVGSGEYPRLRRGCRQRHAVWRIRRGAQRAVANGLPESERAVS